MFEFHVYLFHNSREATCGFLNCLGLYSRWIGATKNSKESDKGHMVLLLLPLICKRNPHFNFKQAALNLAIFTRGERSGERKVAIKKIKPMASQTADAKHVLREVYSLVGRYSSIPFVYFLPIHLSSFVPSKRFG